MDAWHSTYHSTYFCRRFADFCRGNIALLSLMNSQKQFQPQPLIFKFTQRDALTTAISNLKFNISNQPFIFCRRFADFCRGNIVLFSLMNSQKQFQPQPLIFKFTQRDALTTAISNSKSQISNHPFSTSI
jgi:hypothetical protein